MGEMERVAGDELEMAGDLMWGSDDEEGPHNQNLHADESAVSRSTRSQRPELLQGIP